MNKMYSAFDKSLQYNMIHLLYGAFCLHHDDFQGDQILSSIRLIFQEINVVQSWDNILNFKRRLDYGERSFWVDIFKLVSFYPRVISTQAKN
jgi:hypothetical protein